MLKMSENKYFLLFLLLLIERKGLSTLSLFNSSLFSRIFSQLGIFADFLNISFGARTHYYVRKAVLIYEETRECLVECKEVSQRTLYLIPFHEFHYFDTIQRFQELLTSYVIFNELNLLQIYQIIRKLYICSLCLHNNDHLFHFNKFRNLC
jgi:hypothetical protein